MYQYFIIFDWIVFHCMDIPYVVSLFMGWCIYGLAKVSIIAIIIHVYFLKFHVIVSFPLGYTEERNFWVIWSYGFIFWGTDKLFSKVTVPFYMPASKTPGFEFFHNLIMLISLSIQPGYLFPSWWVVGLFPFFTVSFAIISICVQVFVRTCSRSSWIYTKSRCAGSHGNSIYILSNCHTAFYSSCTFKFL